MRTSALRGATLVTCLSWTAWAFAATVPVYTDKAEWLNALSGQFLTEDFSDDQLNDGVSFVSTESGHINPTQQCYQDVLASQSQNEPMTTWYFTPAIIAYGGNWTLGGPGGSGNSLLVYVVDPPLYVGAISNNYGGEFWGFVCDTPFTAVQLVGGAGTNQQHYCLDDMVYSPSSPPLLIGDLNCDGVVNFGDINPFVLALANPDAYAAAYADCEILAADINGDGVVDFRDINAFVQLLTGG